MYHLSQTFPPSKTRGKSPTVNRWSKASWGTIRSRPLDIYNSVSLSLLSFLHEDQQEGAASAPWKRKPPPWSPWIEACCLAQSMARLWWHVWAFVLHLSQLPGNLFRMHRKIWANASEREGGTLHRHGTTVVVFCFFFFPFFPFMPDHKYRDQWWCKVCLGKFPCVCPVGDIAKD